MVSRANLAPIILDLSYSQTSFCLNFWLLEQANLESSMSRVPLIGWRLCYLMTPAFLMERHTKNGLLMANPRQQICCLSKSLATAIAVKGYRASVFIRGISKPICSAMSRRNRRRLGKSHEGLLGQ